MIVINSTSLIFKDSLGTHRNCSPIDKTNSELIATGSAERLSVGCVARVVMNEVFNGKLRTGKMTMNSINTSLLIPRRSHIPPQCKALSA